MGHAEPAESSRCAGGGVNTFLWVMVGYFTMQFLLSVLDVIHKPDAAAWQRSTRVLALVTELVVLLWAIALLRSMP